MTNKWFDVVVAKEYETNKNGKLEKRTAWNKVGRAWYGKGFESLSFELFLLPGHRYVISMRKPQEPTTEPAKDFANFDDLPF
jgi:hypothetical protein